MKPMRPRKLFSPAQVLSVTPITVIDEKTIGTGKPGPVAQRLREIYLNHARRTAI